MLAGRPAKRIDAFLDALSRFGPASFWRKYHAVMATLWFLQIPIAVATSLKSSLPYLIFVSLMTAFSGEMAALHGVTVEEQQTEAVDVEH